MKVSEGAIAQKVGWGLREDAAPGTSRTPDEEHLYAKVGSLDAVDTIRCRINKVWRGIG